MKSKRPRLALFDNRPGSNPSAATLATLAGLALGGRRVQAFSTRACLRGPDLAARATGFPTRQLDPWLVESEDLRREFFLRGSRDAGVSVVHCGGRHAANPNTNPNPNPNPGALAPVPLCLDELRRSLDLPTVAVLRAASEGSPSFHGNRHLAAYDALILEGDPDRIGTLRAFLEHAFAKPVLAALPDLREHDHRLARAFAADDEDQASRLVEALGNLFLRHNDPAPLLALADRAFPGTAREWWAPPGPCHCGHFPARAGAAPRAPAPAAARVALADDEAFRDDFPETVEYLEAAGARVVRFSPLRDESLPHDAELVLMGAGSLCRTRAARLLGNVCLMQGLRDHARRGGRIYAEGGGAALLCESLEIDGATRRGAGLIAARAVWRGDENAAPAVERVIRSENWLAAPGSRIRGYRHDNWEFQGAPAPSEALTAEGDIRRARGVVASLVHLPLATLPGLGGAGGGGGGDGTPSAARIAEAGD